MKVQKLNKELLNLYYKTDKKIYAQIVHDDIYVSDSYRVWKLKYDDFMLDMNKLKTTDLAHFFNEDGYVEGMMTSKYIKIKDILGVQIIDSEGSIDVTINSKYLDMFENYTLKIKSETAPVLVYENDELVGLIVPMRKY